MNFRTYLWCMAVITLVAWSGWLFVLFTIDPSEAGWLGLILHYAVRRHDRNVRGRRNFVPRHVGQTQDLDEPRGEDYFPARDHGQRRRHRQPCTFRAKFIPFMDVGRYAGRGWCNRIRIFTNPGKQEDVKINDREKE